jgi:hypothetical protein
MDPETVGHDSAKNVSLLWSPSSTPILRQRTRIIDLGGITVRDENDYIIPHTSALLESAYRVKVTFADQKNKTKNDKRTQKHSGDTILDPVQCLASIVKRILATVSGYRGIPTINTMCLEKDTFLLSSSYLRDQLRHSCTFMGGSATFGFDATEIETKAFDQAPPWPYS